MGLQLRDPSGSNCHEIVIKALAVAMAGNSAQRGKLLGVKGVALESATLANQTLLTSPTLPAIERYTGVLYEALDAPTLPAAAKKRMAKSILIFSGLWGAVTPADLIPDYKLKMGASLTALGKLSTWWRPRLTPQVTALAQGRQVWNLLPLEHNAAWTPPPEQDQITVKFFERRADGSLVAVSHWNKFLKGALLRHLLEHPETTPSSLESWQHPSGYRLDPLLTQTRGAVRLLSFVQE